jgi:hypothetical protein
VVSGRLLGVLLGTLIRSLTSMNGGVLEVDPALGGRYMSLELSLGNWIWLICLFWEDNSHGSIIMVAL